MIDRDASLYGAWLPLESLIVEQHEVRSIARVAFYLGLLQLHPDQHCGPPISVRPLVNGTYAIMDGNHRFLAHVLAGRTHAPCVIIDESNTGAML